MRPTQRVTALSPGESACVRCNACGVIKVYGESQSLGAYGTRSVRVLEWVHGATDQVDHQGSHCVAEGDGRRRIPAPPCKRAPECLSASVPQCLSASVPECAVYRHVWSIQVASDRASAQHFGQVGWSADGRHCSSVSGSAKALASRSPCVDSNSSLTVSCGPPSAPAPYAATPQPVPSTPTVRANRISTECSTQHTARAHRD